MWVGAGTQTPASAHSACDPPHTHTVKPHTLSAAALWSGALTAELTVIATAMEDKPNASG